MEIFSEKDEVEQVLVNQAPNYLFVDIAQAFDRLKPECPIEVWCGETVAAGTCFPKRVFQRLGPSYCRGNAALSLVAWLRFTIWVSWTLTFKHRQRARFLFVSNPPLFVFLPLITSLRFDCLLYDIYPNALLSRRQTWMIRVISRIWARRNRTVLARADRIFTISPAMRDAIAEYLPADQRSKVRVVPLWADSRIVTQERTRDFRKDWGLANSKIVLYAGNLGRTHPAAPLATLARELVAFRDWMLVVVSSAAQRADVRRLAREHGNVVLREPVPRDDMASLLALAAWGCVVLGDRAGSSSVPSKTYNLLAAGVPLLAFVPVDSEVASLIKSHDVGVRASEHEMASVVRRIATMSDADRAELSQNARLCSRLFTSRLAEEFVPV